MKHNLISLIFALLAFSPIGGSAAEANKVEHLKWNDLDVVWVQDERTPTYQISIYMADGALSDEKGKSGIFEWALEEMTSGTTRHNRREINDTLEFYGVFPSVSTTHEYSTYTFSGLTKDLNPAIKMVCHMFNEANYPDREVAISKKRYRDELISMTNNHSALADRVFRALMFKKTPYEFPSGGLLKDVESFKSKDLTKKLSYIRDQVKKRIYLIGPKDVLDAKDIFLKDCGFSGKAKFVRNETFKPAPAKMLISLIPVTKANQAQVRMGRILATEETTSLEYLDLVESFLGGSFTSLLMREVRVKNGLSYSAGAYASSQKFYGRAGISTFTKNETIGKLLEVVKNTIEVKSKDSEAKEAFTNSVGYLVGSHPFKFESVEGYLNQLIYLDHIGKDYSFLTNFQEHIKNYSFEQISKGVTDFYDWNRMQIVVVGDLSLLPELKKFGEVEVVDYKSFL